MAKQDVTQSSDNQWIFEKKSLEAQLPQTISSYCGKFGKKPEVGDKHKIEDQIFMVLSLNFMQNSIVYGRLN